MSLGDDQAAQTPLEVIRSKNRTAGRKADLGLQREYEYWLRTLTNKEHRAALAIYRELQNQFPEARYRRAYIMAARMVRKSKNKRAESRRTLKKRMTTPMPTTTEAPTFSEAALSFPGPARRPVPVMRPAPDRSAPPSPDSQGLSLREKRELRRQGFTEADVAFLNTEIRNFCECEEAMRRARSPESA